MIWHEGVLMVLHHGIFELSFLYVKSWEFYGLNVLERSLNCQIQLLEGALFRMIV